MKRHTTSATLFTHKHTLPSSRAPPPPPPPPPTHHSCLLVGRQSLLEAVTPMAICITVIYFWYFILSSFTIAATAAATSTTTTSTATSTSRNPRATKAAQVSVHSNVCYCPLSKTPFPRLEDCWQGKCPQRSSTKGTTPSRPMSLISLELRIDWLIHLILVRTGSLLWFAP